MTEIVSKTAFMNAVVAGFAHESFEHSVLGHFDITATRHKIVMARHPYENVELTQIVPFISTNRVYEEARLADLSEWVCVNDPAIFIVTQDESGKDEHCMVDGTHRAMWLHKNGHKYQRAYFIPLEFAVRPDMNLFREIKEFDWGGEILVNGKIVPRG